jgi:hypothetical protein
VLSGVPEVFSDVPKVFGDVPEVFNGGPEVFSCVPEVFTGVPEGFSGVPEVFSGVHVKYPLFFSYFKENYFSRQIFEKHSNTKFLENQSTGSRDTCGQMDRQT